MSAKIRIKEMSNGGLQIAYGDRKTFDIQPAMMKIINEQEGVAVDKLSPEEVKDAFISTTMARVQQDHRLRLQLAVYGRAVLEMHPRGLTNVTCGISREEIKPYMAISTQVGKQAQKLAGAR